jgi:hypothetical protein
VHEGIASQWPKHDLSRIASRMNDRAATLTIHLKTQAFGSDVAVDVFGHGCFSLMDNCLLNVESALSLTETS